MKLYVERHDGQAVTCDDFAAAMADANGVDLEQFKLWYSQAGTPEVMIEARYHQKAGAYEVTVAQHSPPTPGQPTKQPMHIPLVIGALDAQGRDIPLRLEGEAAPATSDSRLLPVTAARQSFRFVNLPEPRALTVNRGFSAPVRSKIARRGGELAFLMAHDSDPFARWEAGQEYATKLILDRVEALQQRDEKAPFDDGYVAALGEILRSDGLDKAFLAEAASLPSEAFVAEQMTPVDVEGIRQAREALRHAVARAWRQDLERLYEENRSDAGYSPDAAAAGRRSLKNMALSYLAALAGEDADALARVVGQYHDCNNMTDRMAALRLLVDIPGPERQQALDDFLARFRDDTLVIDKWLALQAVSALPDTLAQVKGLLSHPAFSLQKPNKVRALVGSFTASNQLRYHAVDGSGYAFHADVVLELDGINPTMAARLLTPLGRWQRFDEERQTKMKAELARILAKPGLSSDVYEIASKSLE